MSEIGYFHKINCNPVGQAFNLTGWRDGQAGKPNLRH